MVITGSSQLSRAGLYSHQFVPGLPAHDGRAVYLQAGGSNWLYYHNSANRWLVSEDASSDSAGIRSDGDARGHACPESVGQGYPRAGGWEKWSSSYSGVWTTTEYVTLTCLEGPNAPPAPP